MTGNEDLVDALQRTIGSRIAADCHVRSLRALSGGANNDTWRFSLEGGGADGDYILRRAMLETDEGLGKRSEALLQQAAQQAGIPVAQVRWILEPANGLGSGYIMAVVEGETIARKILRDAEFAQARTRLARECGRYAAMIHAIDPQTLPPLETRGARWQLDFYQSSYRASGLALPSFDLGFRWLREHAPDESTSGLVHGDFRNGNFIIGEEGLRAVLDWELAHLGDPMEDLGWICVNSWRFGNRAQPVGGFGSREELFAGYAETNGRSPDPQRVHYWEVMGTLKWGIMCMGMSGAGTVEGPASVERAAIGRRTSETEIDLLELLSGGIRCP